jgi:SAM-dependent methyltransferase
MSESTPHAAGPRDPARFARLMNHEDYPRSSSFDPAWVYRHLMGPNCLWPAEDLAVRLALAPGQRVLDLGCGTALTSIFLAREYGLEVWAADLWVDPGDNLARARDMGVADRVFPLRAEAHRLPFAPGFFDAAVSIDAFHYFGTDVRYLSYLAQFVKPGGRIAMASPANAVDPDAAPAPSPALFETFGADWFSFRSADWWRRHWQRTRGVAVEDAAMIEGGRALWLRSLEAAEAWSGVPVAEQPDAALLFAPEGETLGFCRIIARRGSEATLEFGPGDFAGRIA